MNIKSRLKKLETQTGSGQKFCACLQNYFESIIGFIYSGVSSGVKEFALPGNDICPKCQKPVSRRDFEAVRNINQIYGEIEI